MRPEQIVPASLLGILKSSSTLCGLKFYLMGSKFHLMGSPTGLRTLLMQQAFGDEEGVSGALGQTAHEIGIPLGSEGHVDAGVEAFADKGFLQIAADPVEHLEFE